MSPVDPYPRARALLMQALDQCEIPEGITENTPHSGGQNVSWKANGDEVELSFSYYHGGGGLISCSINLGHLAIQTAESFASTTEAVEALVDVLQYLQASVSALLPHTHRQLLMRLYNLKLRRKPSKEDQKGWLSILEQLTPAYSDRRAQMERKLAAERDWRGGSQARLSSHAFASLHLTYNWLRDIARKIKRDCDKELRRFSKERGSKGYSHTQWQTHWKRCAQELYEGEY